MGDLPSINPLMIVVHIGNFTVEALKGNKPLVATNSDLTSENNIAIWPKFVDP